MSSFIKVDKPTLEEIFKFREERFRLRNQRAMGKETEENPLEDLLQKLQPQIRQEELIKAIQDKSSSSVTTVGRETIKQLNRTKDDYGILTAEQLSGLNSSDTSAETLYRAFNRLAESTGTYDKLSNQYGNNKRALIDLLYHTGMKFNDFGIRPPTSGKSFETYQTNPTKWLSEQGDLKRVTLVSFIVKVISDMNNRANSLFHSQKPTAVVTQKITSSKGKEPIAVDANRAIVPTPIKKEYSRMGALNGHYDTFDQLVTAIRDTVSKKNMSDTENQLVKKNLGNLRSKSLITKGDYRKIMAQL